jgi:hypothetical protein
MRMVVMEGVTLVKPLADGKDYSGGDVIELQEAVAQDWQRRGWVGVPLPSRSPFGVYTRRSKGVHD